MKKWMMAAILSIQLFTVKAQKYDKYPFYSGNDLGLTFSPAGPLFKIWAPTASAAQVIFYDKAIGGDTLVQHPMIKGKSGTWLALIKQSVEMPYYAFRVKINEEWSKEVTDPYVKAVGVNGTRGIVIDLKETNPPGWQKDKSPVFKSPTDAIIYELHIRDASIAANSGITGKGKFLGLTEKGTKNTAGLSTGLDHLKEMGVTHIHLLPFFDFRSIDEISNAKYNWGYDPLNYNVPEGTYSSNASDPPTRIKELKQLVKTFHDNGLRVVMDVVYNHTGQTENSNFNQLVPGYYYRQTADGKFSDATACGNETASERPMMRKFILESMKYWVQEYHIDGFRIDLMGVHDIETMNLVSKELHKIKPGILLYGEGWTAGSSPLPDSVRALKKYAYKLDRIAVFSDDIRDGIKGHVFTPSDKGFVSGKHGMEESVKFGIVASCQHPQVDYKKVNYSKAAYAAEPSHTITYCECHDNHALWDKLNISAKEATEEERRNMHKLALSIVLTSQGISFLHAGTEFLRSKKGIENSFESPDSINAIDWDLKTKNKDVADYVSALIRMRKEHPAFRMSTAKQISNHIRFIEGLPGGIIAYMINGAAIGDKWKKILVVFNGTGKAYEFLLPGKGYNYFVKDNLIINSAKTHEEKLIIQPYSCSIFYQ